MKRFLSIILVLLITLSVGAMGAYAAESTNQPTGAGVIKFNSSKWNNVKAVYCYIWMPGGKSFFPWGKTDNAKCDNVQGPIWQYDISKLKKSEDIKGGLKSNEDYCVIFFADTGVQTYDLTIGLPCIGSTAKMTGKMIENPKDSKKQGYEAVWSDDNSKKYGPHLGITSIGSFVGTNLCPNEQPERVIGDWIIGYPATSQYCKPDEVVATALKKFNVKDIGPIINYLKVKEKNNQTDLAQMDVMIDYLNKGYNLAYQVEPTYTTAPPADLPDDPKDVIPTSGNGDSSPSGEILDKSYSGPDGESDVLIFTLSSIMILVIFVLAVTRKKREE